jgi:S-adenosylmethionine synthetase
MSIRLFTSESVSEGHPDKVADQISDAILDGCLEQDPGSRCAVETLLGLGFAVITGEVTTDAYVEMKDVVRNVILSLGYDSFEKGLDGMTCGVLVSVNKQSGDIAQGVDSGGAGDQGMMFGMAVRETPELMPLPISLAHALMRRQAEVKRTSPELGFRPDAKSQVTIAYENGVPKYIHTVVLSCQHKPMKQAEVHERVREHIIDPVLAQYSSFVDVSKNVVYHINPTGSFVLGGPQADSGLTGRKIIVDTYGGFCPHGGGAFSGKDPSKVDRSASYMARYAAKNIVAAGLADRVQISLAYAIGVADPIQVSVDTFGTGRVSDDAIEDLTKCAFDFKPAGIAEKLRLRSQSIKYQTTAVNGHFGNPDFPWEKTDMVSALKA